MKRLLILAALALAAISSNAQTTNTTGQGANTLPAPMINYATASLEVTNGATNIVMVINVPAEQFAVVAAAYNYTNQDQFSGFIGQLGTNAILQAQQRVRQKVAGDVLRAPLSLLPKVSAALAQPNP